MKTRKMVMAGIGMLLFGLVSGANAAEVQKFVWGSGPMGGLWRIGVGAAVQLINEQYKDKYFYTAAASGGGLENARRLASGEFDTAWVNANIMEEAWTGTGLFEGQKANKDLRAMIFMGDQTVCVITLAKSPIKSYKDLSGKKVNVGPPGSSGGTIAKSVFKALGVDAKLSFLNQEGAAQGLKDGHLDAALAPGDPFTPSFVELARSTTIRLVEPSKAEMEIIDKKIPYMDVKVIAPNTAPGENADKPRNSFVWGQYWLARPTMPAQAVYDALKVTQEPKNREALTKVMSLWAVSGPEFKPLVKLGIPLHPGAAKYWQEKGVKLAPELIK